MLPQLALYSDLLSCTYELNPPDYERAASSPLKAKPGDGVSVVVKYFKTNDTGLFAVVECAIPLIEGAAVGMDLIVAGKGEEKSMSVEDVYGEVY